MLDGVSGALENMFDRIVRQGLQPQLLDLIELVCPGVGRVILIVIVQTE